jgi:hypothetical protein
MDPIVHRSLLALAVGVALIGFGILLTLLDNTED